MRVHDPLKQWKLSPMDLESRRRWEHYTYAKEEMFQRTHIPEARWWLIEGVDKKRARFKLHPSLAAANSLWGRSPRTNRNAGTGASAGLSAPPGSQGDVCAGGVLLFSLRSPRGERSRLPPFTLAIHRPGERSTPTIVLKSWPTNSSIPRLVGSKVSPTLEYIFRANEEP